MSKVNLYTSRRSWERTQSLLTSLTAEDLQDAAEQQARYHRITNPAVRELLKHITRVGSSAPGSDEKKSYMLAELKSSIVYFGCPIIYITINPCDLHSPLTLLYAGVEIDIHDFVPEWFPWTDRVKILQKNPLAVIEYFHNTVKTIIEQGFKGGMFGELTHYYGPIEYQGRMTPHTHLAVKFLVYNDSLTP